MKETSKAVPLPDGVDDHGRFQRRFWIVQRCAWVVFAVVLIACLLGLLGRGGPFSRSVVQTAQGSLDLPAISRWNAPDELKVTLSASDQDRTVILDPPFLEAFSVEGIDPPQKQTFARDGHIGYVFAADATAETTVIFRLQTQRPGLRSYAIGIGNDASERSTFIFP
ncbi:hypothetical protein [Aliirhizobium smilacinae]|uniref:Uncharacterized protein n=1 Tax=Aliirhizobium smilacinae TaxID=1395944 RepID=A0A5C4XNR9_9HYPH|nr:hypothetical protein [Rhizobium smilacinae]TNM64978.1 hypothetical protein FHP24_01355 [Rhizobium smilacinae]